jgi:hypothetical protein
MTKANPALAPSRPDKACHNHKTHHPKYDRSQAFGGSEEEDRIGQYDPWYYKQSGANAAPYGGAQSTFRVVVYLCYRVLVTPRIRSLLY